MKNISNLNKKDKIKFIENKKKNIYNKQIIQSKRSKILNNNYKISYNQCNKI